MRKGLALDDNVKPPQTLSHFIHSRLRWRIITGDLKPGQALREMDIEAEYGSSRGPVRESLRLLLLSGLVEHQQRRGFRVRDYTPEDVCNIYELRAKLEGMVVSSLEGHDLSALCETLRGRLQIMKSCYQQKDVEGYFEENSRFHQSIIDFTGNKPLAQVIFYVNEMSLPIRYKLIKNGFPTRRSLNYHRQITEHLEAHRIEEAKVVTEEHILENRERAMAFYEHRGAPKHGSSSS